MRHYVERLVYRKPVSLVGPFPDEEQATAHMRRMILEEVRQVARKKSLGQSLQSPDDVLFRVIPETDIET